MQSRHDGSTDCHRIQKFHLDPGTFQDGDNDKPARTLHFSEFLICQKPRQVDMVVGAHKAFCPIRLLACNPKLHLGKSFSVPRENFLQKPYDTFVVRRKGQPSRKQDVVRILWIPTCSRPWKYRRQIDNIGSSKLFFEILSIPRGYRNPNIRLPQYLKFIPFNAPILHSV